MPTKKNCVQWIEWSIEAIMFSISTHVCMWECICWKGRYHMEEKILENGNSVIHSNISKQITIQIK